VGKTHFSGEDKKVPKPAPRRAGLLDDERDPDEAPQPAGSATGGSHAAGAPAGGMAAGGMAGSNAGDGTPVEAELEDALGSSMSDQTAESADAESAYAGQSGGAVGGTPANKRVTGGSTHRGIAPGTVHRGDSTVGSNPESKTNADS